MSRITRHRVIAFAKEATYGIDAIDAGATTVHLLGKKFDIEPLNGDDVDLDYDDGTGGNSLQVLTGNYAVVKFAVDWAGAGAATTAAKYAPLLEACLRKTTIGASDVRYEMDEEGSASLTLYFYHSGVLHRLTGARGNVTFTANAKAIPEFMFTFTGLFNPVIAEARPALNLTGWQKPVPVGVEHSAATLGGIAVKLLEFNGDQGNEVSYQEYVGHQEIQVSDFKTTGSMTLQAPDLASFDPFSIAIEGTQQAFSFSHGPALNQVGWQANLQLGRPTYGDQNGTATYTVPFRVLSNTDYFFTK